MEAVPTCKVGGRDAGAHFKNLRCQKVDGMIHGLMSMPILGPLVGAEPAFVFGVSTDPVATQSTLVEACVQAGAGLVFALVD
jgi:hypothetical protein